MGLGAVVIAPGGAAHRLSQATSFTGCNNEAELRALLLALRWLQAQGGDVAGVRVFSDSSILVEQMTTCERPIARLAPLVDEVRGVLGAFAALGPLAVQWLPRRRNGEADALARAALGLAPKAALSHAARKRQRKRQKPR
ncbi:MAG: reverse transcriptase-like protein [Acidovorax sp.]